MLKKLLSSVAFWMTVPTGLLGVLSGYLGGATLFEFGLLTFGGCFAGLGSWAMIHEVERGCRYPYIGLGVAAVGGSIVAMVDLWPGVLLQFAAVISLAGFSIVRAVGDEWQAGLNLHAEATQK